MEKNLTVTMESIIASINAFAIDNSNNYPAFKKISEIINEFKKNSKTMFEEETKISKEKKIEDTDKAVREYFKTLSVATIITKEDGTKEEKRGSRVTTTYTDGSTKVLELKDVKDNNFTGYILDEDGERVPSDKKEGSFETTWRRYYQVQLPKIESDIA